MLTFSYREAFQWVVAAVLLLFGALIALFWINREYQIHLETVKQVREAYVSLRKAEVKAIIDQLAENIEFVREGVDSRLKSSVAEQTRTAIQIAEAIYESEKDEQSQEEIKKLIIDALMAIRFFNGNGYYWIHDTDHVLVAHPYRQDSIGSDDSRLIDSSGRFIIQDFVSAALSGPQGGFVSYYWPKPGVDELYHLVKGSRKVAGLMLFKPFNWVIGTGDYVEDVEAQAQQEELRRLAAVRYGEAGYIFNHDRNGICLNHINQEIIGQDRWEMLDAGGMKIVAELDRVGRQPGGGFLEYYASIDPRTGEPARKLSFVRSVEDWGWVFGGGVYLEDVESRLEALNKEMAGKLRANIIIAFISFGIILALALLIIRRLMLSFTRELDYVIAGEGTDDSKPIKIDRLRFTELREIAEKSNSMLAQKAKVQGQLAHARKMESVGMLAGGIAHDFNNLLHAMGGNLELLDRKIPEDHPGKKRIQTIQRSINRAAQLVRQMLLFSRKAEAQRQDMDLNRQVKEASEMLERSISKMISIELDLDKDARFINADPIQVEQVLLNLATNAADAMPDGGRLIIETSNVDVDEALANEHTELKSGQYILLTVSDTGCGMDEEILDKVFDPFFTTKEVGKGTGLGLASVYGIIKDHGGYISSHSQPGKGTTFKIYWPGVNTKLDN